MYSDTRRSWIGSLPGMDRALGASLGILIALLVADGLGIPIGIAVGAALGLPAGAAARPSSALVDRTSTPFALRQPLRTDQRVSSELVG